jgi:glycosyltransferase involved in cell wall biosynthesis
MRPLYRIEAIIEAVAHLKNTFPHITLVCSQYGADPVYQKKIHTLVREKNLEDQVVFMPENTPDRTIQEIYALCDTVVMVPLSDGMPSCLMEAWASRKPAIVSNIANYEDPWHEHLVLKSV